MRVYELKLNASKKRTTLQWMHWSSVTNLTAFFLSTTTIVTHEGLANNICTKFIKYILIKKNMQPVYQK